MGIIDLLTSSSIKDPKKGDNTELGKVLAVGIPIILMAMRTKSQDDKKAKDIGKALEDHEEIGAGNVLDRLNKNDQEDGQKILGHVLGEDQDKVVQDISQKTGVSPEDVRRILAQASPAMMEELADQTKGDRSPDRIRDVTDSELKRYQQNPEMPDLQDILSGVLNGFAGSSGSVVGNLLKKLL